MKRFFTIIVAMCVAVSAFAQNTSIKLTLIDASTGEGVPFATVSITPEGATKASKYVLTTEKGAATIDGVKKGNYTVKAELLGYKSFSQDVKAEGRTLDLGNVQMEIDTEVLDAASVSAVGNPIVVKKDTVEYNATMFRTTDSDMLIDLLKKLPGIEVGSDGSVKANGKNIDKITIDGKTFFLDDPQLATQNLPAKLIEKVKVVEKKSDQAIFTGIDDGEEENIIDLTVKPGMMNGWFGNLTAGGGYDMTAEALTAKGKTTKDGEAGDAGWDHARFSLNSMVGNFKDKGQIALILNANNANRQGFGGGGGMGGGMMGGGMMGGAGMGGGGGLGLSGSGITTSWMAGLNGAYNFLDDDMEFAGDYVYNGSTNYLESDNYRESYQTNGMTNYSKTVGSRTNLNQGHRIGLRIDYDITKNTSILFEPQFSFNYGNQSSNTNDITRMAETGTLFENANFLNQGFTLGDSKNNSWSTSGRFLLRQRLGKPGRTMTVSARYSFSQNNSDGLNQSLNQTQNPVDAQFMNAVTNQYYQNKSNSSSVRSEATYTEPLATGLYLETSYQYNWSKSLSNKNTFDIEHNAELSDMEEIRKDLIDAGASFLADVNRYMSDRSWYDSHFNAVYSNDIVNQTQTHRAGLLLQYQKEALRLQIGGAYQPTITDNTTTGRDPYHKVDHNWSPRARIEYEFNDNSNFFINYNGRSSQPSTSQLLPVPDNSNPRSVSFGNPYLTSSFSHNLNGRFGYTNRSTFSSINAFGNASMNQNGISNATWTDSKGINYSMPLNGKLTGSASLGMFLYTPIAKSNFSINNMTNISYSASKSYVGRADKTQALLDRYYNAQTADFRYSEFYNDFFAKDAKEDILEYFVDNTTTSLNVMERLQFTYRNDYIEANLGATTNVSKPWYSKEMQKQQAAQWRNSATASFQWNTMSGFGLQTNLNYNWYVGYTTKQPDEWIWNAQISHTLFNRQATLTLLAYDILGMSRTLTVTDSSNYHQESRSNTLGRYVMLTFTWRFGTFGGRGGRGGFGGGRGGFGGGRGMGGGMPMGGGRGMGGGMPMGGGRPF